MEKNLIIPPYLQPGNTIGITCPSGYMPKENAKTCIETLKKWGFKVKIGKTLGNQFHYFSGTDKERLTDLQKMLDDPKIDAILCGRGGYGMSRIIDNLDFTQFRSKPKWIIGYSDITLLHNHLHNNIGVTSIHSPMAGAFNNGQADNLYIQSLHSSLLGEKQVFSIKNESHFCKIGEATAPLIGGNLTLLVTAIGTASDVNYDGKILFIEDVGEYIYGVDRMFLQLKRAGKLDNLKGLILGSFSDMKDTTIPFGQSTYETINEHVKDYDYPIAYNFPVGHTDENLPLKIGVDYQLNVDKSGILLIEKGA